MKHSVKQTSLKAVALGALLLMAILPMRAQWYTGGRIAFTDTYWHDIIKISPEVGYAFTSHWALGLTADFQKFHEKPRYVYTSTDKMLAAIAAKKRNAVCVLNPYVRFSFFSRDRFSLFIDATASLDVLDTRYWSAGICPGVSCALTDHFLAVAKAGFFGYNNEPYAWEANLDLTKMNLSLYYLFGKKGQ